MTGHETKAFKKGDSEAARLPGELGFGPRTPVAIERTGDNVADPAHDKAALDRVLAAMRTIGAPPDGVQPRLPFEWIDRPGL